MSVLRRISLHGLAADVAIAAAFFAVGQAEAWSGGRAGGDGPPFHGPRVLQALMVALVTVPLAWRRSRLLPAAAAVSAALAAQVLLVAPGVSFLAGLLPMAVMVYSVAAWAPPRRRLFGLACLLGAQAILTARISEMRSTGEILFGTFVTAGMWFVGDLSRVHRGRANHLAARTRHLEAERAQWKRVAIAEERGRIARELHDVIAHSVSLMGVQAGAARTQLDVDPERARHALRAIEATAREAVVELRRLLLILRDGEPQVGLEPQPGMAEIDSLVVQMRAAGLPIDLSVEGEAVALPPGVALSAYRIVQEALTNTLKHAGDARAAVHIAYADEMLELEIADQGERVAERNGVRGHGLIGMRERAALYGGSLEAGHRPEGGFTVRARLPSKAHTG